MSENEREYLEIIKGNIYYRLETLNWRNEDVGFWLDGILFGISNDCSGAFYVELMRLRNKYLGLEGRVIESAK